MLEFNTSLKRVVLVSSQLTRKGEHLEGVQRLEAVLRRNATVTALDVSENDIPQKRLAKYMFKTNKTKQKKRKPHDRSQIQAGSHQNINVKPTLE